AIPMVAADHNAVASARDIARLDILDRLVATRASSTGVVARDIGRTLEAIEATGVVGWAARQLVTRTRVHRARRASLAPVAAGVGIVPGRGWRQRIDDRTGGPVLDRPDRVDLVPAVIGVVHPGPEDRHPLTDEREGQLLALHDLRDELTVLGRSVPGVEEVL